MIPFDVDITAWAGQQVMIEFGCDGEIHGPDYADWDEPRIEVLGNTGPSLFLPASHITPIASSSHPDRPPARAADDSGMTAQLHDNDPCNMWLSGTLTASQGNRNPGTAVGAHWIRFDFDRLHNLREMGLWNYNEINHPLFGAKDITIESSPTGGWDSAEWNTILVGQLPAPNDGGLSSEPRHLTVYFDDAPTQHVVLTAAGVTYSDRNWSIDSPPELEETGLSEARFYVLALGPADCAQAIAEGYGHPADLNQDCRINLADLTGFIHDWLNCMDPTDPQCTHPW